MNSVLQAYDIFLWKTEQVIYISDVGSGSGEKQERTKERRDQLQVVDTNKPMVHPDLLADLASHRPGFIDCKLRTCVELCYSLSYDIMHCIVCTNYKHLVVC